MRVETGTYSTPPARLVSLPSWAVVLGVAVVAACGGPSAEPAPVQVAPAVVEEPEAAVGPAPSEEASKRYAALSKELEDFGSGKAVNLPWLESELQAILALHPKHSAARFNAAILAAHKGDKAAARKAYEAIVKDDTGFAPASEKLAAALVEQCQL